jgi:hypothetical protein
MLINEHGEPNPYFVFLVMHKEKCTYAQAVNLIKKTLESLS